MSRNLRRKGENSKFNNQSASTASSRTTADDDDDDGTSLQSSYNMPLRLISEFLLPFEEPIQKFVRWLHEYAEAGRHHQLGYQSQLYVSLLQQQQKASFLAMQRQQLLADAKGRQEEREWKRQQVQQVNTTTTTAAAANNNNNKELSFRSGGVKAKELVREQQPQQGESVDKDVNPSNNSNINNNNNNIIDVDDEAELEEQKQEDLLRQELEKRQRELEQQREADLSAILEHQKADHERHHSFIHEWAMLCFCGAQVVNAIVMTVGVVITVIVALASPPDPSVTSEASILSFETSQKRASRIHVAIPYIAQVVVAVVSAVLFYRTRSLAGGLRARHVAICCALASVFAVSCAFARSFRSALLILFSASVLGFLGTSESSRGGFYIFAFAVVPSIVATLVIFILRFSVAKAADGDFYSYLRDSFFPERETIYGGLLATSTIANCVDLAAVALSCYLDVPPLPPGAGELVDLVKKAALRFIRHRSTTAMLLSAQHTPHTHTSDSRRIREALGRVAALIDAIVSNTPANLIEQLAARGQSHLERISSKRTVADQKTDFEVLKRATWDLEGALVSQLESHLRTLEQQHPDHDNNSKSAVGALGGGGGDHRASPTHRASLSTSQVLARFHQQQQQELLFPNNGAGRTAPRASSSERDFGFTSQRQQQSERVAAAAARRVLGSSPGSNSPGDARSLNSLNSGNNYHFSAATYETNVNNNNPALFIRGNQNLSSERSRDDDAPIISLERDGGETGAASFNRNSEHSQQQQQQQRQQQRSDQLPSQHDRLHQQLGSGSLMDNGALFSGASATAPPLPDKGDIPRRRGGAASATLEGGDHGGLPMINLVGRAGEAGGAANGSESAPCSSAPHNPKLATALMSPAMFSSTSNRLAGFYSVSMMPAFASASGAIAGLNAKNGGRGGGSSVGTGESISDVTSNATSLQFHADLLQLQKRIGVVSYILVSIPSCSTTAKSSTCNDDWIDQQLRRGPEITSALHVSDFIKKTITETTGGVLHVLASLSNPPEHSDQQQQQQQQSMFAVVASWNISKPCADAEFRAMQFASCCKSMSIEAELYSMSDRPPPSSLGGMPDSLTQGRGEEGSSVVSDPYALLIAQKQRQRHHPQSTLASDNGTNQYVNNSSPSSSMRNNPAVSIVGAAISGPALIMLHLVHPQQASSSKITHNSNNNNNNNNSGNNNGTDAADDTNAERAAIEIEQQKLKHMLLAAVEQQRWLVSDGIAQVCMHLLPQHPPLSGSTFAHKKYRIAARPIDVVSARGFLIDSADAAALHGATPPGIPSWLLPAATSGSVAAGTASSSATVVFAVDDFFLNQTELDLGKTAQDVLPHQQLPSDKDTNGDDDDEDDDQNEGRNDDRRERARLGTSEWNEQLVLIDAFGAAARGDKEAALKILDEHHHSNDSDLTSWAQSGRRLKAVLQM